MQVVFIALAVAIAAAAAVIYVLSGNAAWLLERGSPAPAKPVASAASAASLAPAVAANGASEAPAPPKVTTETFGDWIVACPVGQTDPAACVAQQQLVSSTGAAVLVWSIQRDAGGTLHAVWRVPTGVLLNRGLSIDLGDGKPSAIPFSACDSRSCAARAVIAPDYLQKLEAATQISTTVTVEATGKAFGFHLSAKGLSDALAKLAAH
jgi:invasion protein IalB